VHTRKLLFCCSPWRNDLSPSGSPFVRDDLHDFGALPPLRVAGRGFMLGETWGRNEKD
jgi:hypothetical protein